jgi:hypothetical protein
LLPFWDAIVGRNKTVTPFNRLREDFFFSRISCTLGNSRIVLKIKRKYDKCKRRCQSVPIIDKGKIHFLLFSLFLLLLCRLFIVNCFNTSRSSTSVISFHKEEKTKKNGGKIYNNLDKRMENIFLSSHHII